MLCSELFAARLASEARRAEWSVRFAPGRIGVVAKRKDECVTDEVLSAGEAARLVLCDVTPKCDTHTVRIINVSVVDKNGTVLPDCNERIYVESSGVEVFGISNGNPNGTQPNIAYDIELFHGRAQIITTAGSAAVTVYSDGLDGVTV